MTKKTFLLLAAALVLLAVTIFFITHSMKTPCYQLGELPERFVHQHQVSDFDTRVFNERRQRVVASIDADILIISAAPRHDFRYLTGFPERSGIAVIEPEGEVAYRLFVTPWEIYTVMWTGEVYGTEGALEKFGANEAYPLDEFEKMLPGLLLNKQRIAVHGDDQRIRTAVEKVLQQQDRRAEITDMTPILHEHRVFKDPWEVAQLQQAVDVTIKAHNYIMQTVRPGLAEYEVQAGIEYIYRRNGLSVGFSSIIGSGSNSCLLHHTRNDRTMNDGDILLIDIGAASLGSYVADITRTIPVSGTFSPRQREIYELVLMASDRAMEKMKPGYRMLDCNHEATSVLVEGLHRMGLIPDTTSWWQKRFYIQHRVNHYIGLQVHDVGNYGFDTQKRDEHILTPEIRGRELESGMVLTLEPGLYFMVGMLDGIHEMFGHLASKEELDAFVKQVRPIYEHYEGIGVRIEDDILITDDGYVNLSAHAPRTVEEIENTMR